MEDRQFQYQQHGIDKELSSDYNSSDDITVCELQRGRNT